jgi:eukaryotic-like serine/threonine-protein kinase
LKKPIPFGKYYLLERINVGGMAEVFRAKAYGVEGFERLVAVKRILPQIAEDGEFITMFVDEAKIAVQLNHANIAQIFDLGVVDGAYFIALEHIHGRDLRAIFERGRQRGEAMPVAQACFVAMKMCEALDYAHNKRDQAGRDMSLVHRDVSPQNVLISFEGEVKLIDFGIAKAAGKVGKTQAGILKGKFGYMSPEQVRGLSIDRRSDVFSCGIVLYEILTGERLFVGESDFSTLEKVRNVEILPPSTYNKKIPEELERIVLKALAKDVDDRYQNAIDLHDELQAFVYTAGEFYSRKDLAGWMKQTFAKEIDEETKKLEEFRQLAPPTADDAPAPRARQTLPPPLAASPAGSPPKKITIPPPVVDPPRRPEPRSSQQLRAASDTRPPSKPSSSKSKKKSGMGADLEWDEEELETQIYDNPPAVELAARDARPQSAGPPLPRAPESLVSTGPELTVPERMQIPGGGQSPTLSLRGGQSKPPPTGLPLNAKDTAPSRPARSSGGFPAAEEPRANGRATAPSPAAVVKPQSRVPASPSLPPPPVARGTFAPEIATRKPAGQSRGLFIAVGVAVALLAIVSAWFLFGTSDPQPATPPTEEQAKETPVGPVDPSSGFDITTEPMGAKIRLDGNPLGNAPLRVRNLGAGKHVLEIEGPKGWKSRREEVVIVAGKAETLTFRLEPEGQPEVRFQSEPPGAKITLVAEGTGARTPVGSAPTHTKIDPAIRYQVVFELEGYAPVEKPLVFGGAETTITAVLQPKAKDAPPPPEPKRTPPPEPKRTPLPEPKRTPTPEPEPRRPRPTPTEPRETGPREATPLTPKETGGPSETPVKQPAQADGNGKISIGAKPQCLIFINGRDIGKTTPLRDFEVPAGSLTVTLINTEFGIREQVQVTVKPGETAKVIKDFTDRIPK